MNDVRVSVVLTNIVDQINSSAGRLPATSTVRTYITDAIVDSEDVFTFVSQHVADVLGVTVLGSRMVQAGDGISEVVNVVGPLGFDIDGRTTIEEAVVLGSKVLIGRTVLDKMDLHVDCANCKVIGNPAHPDHAVIKIR